MNRIGLLSGGGQLPILIGKSLLEKNYEVIFFVIKDYFNKKKLLNHSKKKKLII